MQPIVPPTERLDTWVSQPHTTNPSGFRKSLIYATMITTLLSWCILPKGSRSDNTSSPNALGESATTPNTVITHAEIQSVIDRLHANKDIYPLNEINPLFQKELDTICTQIQNDLIAGQILCSLVKVKMALSWALWKIFGDIPEEDICIGLVPVTKDENWSIFAKISARLWGRSYTSSLMIPTENYMTTGSTRPLNDGELATMISQSMKDEFLIHIRHKLEAALSIQTISDDSIPEILEIMRPLLLDEEEWFRAIGHPLSGPVTIPPIGDKDVIDVIITTKSPEWELKFTF